ncbi:MAG: hypothetical protein P4M08_12785 [Oligoflexia bacterium]|nr:hypothetical protein [Oligoflexia bacterium]
MKKTMTAALLCSFASLSAFASTDYTCALTQTFAGNAPELRTEKSDVSVEHSFFDGNNLVVYVYGKSSGLAPDKIPLNALQPDAEATPGELYYGDYTVDAGLLSGAATGTILINKAPLLGMGSAIDFTLNCQLVQ